MVSGVSFWIVLTCQVGVEFTHPDPMGREVLEMPGSKIFRRLGAGKSKSVGLKGRPLGRYPQKQEAGEANIDKVVVGLPIEQREAHVSPPRARPR